MVNRDRFKFINVNWLTLDKYLLMYIKGDVSPMFSTHSFRHLVFHCLFFPPAASFLFRNIKFVRRPPSRRQNLCMSQASQSCYHKHRVGAPKIKVYFQTWTTETFAHYGFIFRQRLWLSQCQAACFFVTCSSAGKNLSVLQLCRKHRLQGGLLCRLVMSLIDVCD